MVEHGAGWQGAVGSTFSGLPALQHPFSLTKAAAVAAVHRCTASKAVCDLCELQVP